MRLPAKSGRILIALVLAGAGIPAVLSAPDVRVNGTGDTAEQREVAIARRPADTTYINGILCAAWNDVVNNQLGYGYSLNGGFNWTDKGGLPAAPDHKATADPDVDFRLLDSQFYISGHDTTPHRGIAIHRSQTCDLSSSFEHADVYRDTAAPRPDKPMMTINNWAGPAGNPRDPAKYHDRLFIAATIEGNPRPLAIWRSDDGTTWSPSSPTLVRPYPSGYDLKAGTHGPWLTTAPSGRLYVAWVRFQDDPSCTPNCWNLGPLDMQVSRSTDGGVTFTMESSPLLGGRNPHHTGCDLPGNIRVIASPQIEADNIGYVHMVYMAGDPLNSTDYSDVYYTRGVPDGSGNLVWSTPVQLNTDTGSADQFMPSLMVPDGTQKLAVYWYDRRNATDSTNPQFQMYRRISSDRGVTWGSETIVSDVISPTGGGGCDSLGDYNEGFADSANLYMIWSDRRTQSSSNDTNIFFERVNVSGVCTVDYCAGEGTRCHNTGSSEACCTYQSIEDWNCTGPDLVPPNACPCSVLQ